MGAGAFEQVGRARNGGDGSAGSGPGEFFEPRGLASDAEGNMYVAEMVNHRVQVISNDGAFSITGSASMSGICQGSEPLASMPSESSMTGVR